MRVERAAIAVPLPKVVGARRRFVDKLGAARACTPSAVAYLDERRARRLGIGAQPQARDRAAARLGEAVLRYERHVLGWYPLGREAEARGAVAEQPVPVESPPAG